jgi:hypothetical protein
MKTRTSIDSTPREDDFQKSSSTRSKKKEQFKQLGWPATTDWTGHRHRSTIEIEIEIESN